MLIAILLAGFGVGLMIGSVGVGGVLLAPILTFVLGMELHLALATSSMSFLFAGFAGTWAYARRGSIPWRWVGWITLGVIPGTLLGARTNVSLPATTLTLILGGLILVSGLSAFRRPGERSHTRKLSPIVLGLLGLLVGFGSALTGTGGPVLLIPTLLLLGAAALATVGTSQAIQIPIAAFAILGFLLFGKIDLRLGATLGIGEAVGVLLGAALAHRLPASRLKQLVAIALLTAGLLIMTQSFR